jgi:two-component system response regulator QseB
MRVLLVEDDELLGDALRLGLSRDGYTVDWLKDGRSALQALKVENFDLVVLDINLPEMSGFHVVQHARRSGIKIPVLILTARDSKQDRIEGLDSGADDYLSKPFDLDELCARLRALRRRFVDQARPKIHFGNVTLDPAAHTVRIDGLVVNLPRREFSLLRKLIESPGQVLGREALMQSLYGWEDEVDSNALEVHIHNLRKKLKDSFYIRTIRGIGYMVDKIND